MDLLQLPLHTGQDIGDNGLGIFRPGIIRGDHHHIGQVLGDGPHNGPFGFIPVSPAAKQTDETSGGKVPRGGQDVLQGVGAVGVIDDDGIGRRNRDHLHPALYPVDRGHDPSHLLQTQAQAQSGGQGRQGVVDRKPSGDGQVDAD